MNTWSSSPHQLLLSACWRALYGHAVRIRAGQPSRRRPRLAFKQPRRRRTTASSRRPPASKEGRANLMRLTVQGQPTLRSARQAGRVGGRRRPNLSEAAPIAQWPATPHLHCGLGKQGFASRPAHRRCGYHNALEYIAWRPNYKKRTGKTVGRNLEPSPC
jgi:hypothetical protein